MIQSSPSKNPGQWNMVLEHQRQQQLVRDHAEKEDEQRRKLIYRDELQKLIEEQRYQRSQEKNIDLEQLQLRDDQLKQREYADTRKQAFARVKAQEFLGISLDLDKQKKQREYEVNVSSQELERQITMNLQKKDQQDQYSKMMNKDKVKQDLQLAYKEMEQVLIILKYEREKSWINMFQNRMKKRQCSMRVVIQKLKKYKEMKYNNIIKSNKFLDRLRSGQQATQQTVMDQINYKQQRAQVFQDQKKHDLFKVRNQLMDYQNQKSLEFEDLKYKKLKYQEELRMQMIRDKERKFQEGQMSAIELNLNRRHIDGYYNGDVYSQISAPLPGVTSRPDFERQKQTDHLDLQLNNQQPDNYIIKKRLRNISAYQAANSIILNQPKSYSPENTRQKPIQGY